jgi:hypothetical protein
MAIVDRPFFIFGLRLRSVIYRERGAFFFTLRLCSSLSFNRKKFRIPICFKES